MAFHHFSLILLLFLLACNTQSKNHRVNDSGAHILNSPKGDVEARLWVHPEDGEPKFSVSYKGQNVVGVGELGFTLKDGDLSNNFTESNFESGDYAGQWEQPWGEQRVIDDVHSWMKMEMLHESTGRLLTIHMKVYDDGVGFRYEFPEQEKLDEFIIMKEHTKFDLYSENEAWYIDSYIPNRYEHIPKNTVIADVDTAHTPFTFKTSDGVYASIHEAALTDYSAMSLASNGADNLSVVLYPWMDGSGDKVRAKAPFVSPWRTLKLASEPGGLITNYIDLNLNEPSKIEDTSWIKPGKYVGIWWDMHLETKSWASGEKHGATTEYTKEWIDFASEHGFAGVLVEGWNIGWDGNWINNANAFNFTESYPDYDLPYLTEYAQSKGTNIVMHNETSTGIENYEAQMDEAYQMYEDLGMNTIKSGYVGDMIANGQWHHGQYMVRHYRKAVETAAKHGIMLDVHEPIKDTGIRRTWPNMMTREGARGQEYNAWSPDGGNPPDYVPTIAFTRMLSGPFDYTPGVLDIMLEDNRADRDKNRLQHTQAKELALYVVIYSPLHMAADLMKNYEKYPEAFQFIKDVPVDWETTKVLSAAIGEHVTFARKDRNSEDWYIGAVTNEEARELSFELDFLSDGITYTAQMYVDGEDASYEDNPYALDIIEKEFQKGDTLQLKLATSGGAAIRFVAKED